MLKILKYLLILFIANIILATFIYSMSSLKSGNRADIIEFIGIVSFFSILLILNIIMYSILHYVFNLENKIILIVTNLFVLFLILNNHTENWKNPYLLICTPVYFVLESITILIYRNQIKKS